MLVPNRRYVKTRAEGKAAREPDLFCLVVVNSYGSQEVQRLKDDDSIPLKLGSEWMCVGWGSGRGEGRGVDWITGLYISYLAVPQTRCTLHVSGRRT